jgi:hypothetical protein
MLAAPKQAFLSSSDLLFGFRNSAPLLQVFSLFGVPLLPYDFRERA